MKKAPLLPPYMRTSFRAPLDGDGPPRFAGWIHLGQEARSYVLFAEGYAIPERFDVHCNFPYGMSFGIELQGGRPECVSISSVRGGPPLRKEMLNRLSIKELVKEASKAVLLKEVDGEWRYVRDIAPSDQDAAATVVEGRQAVMPRRARVNNDKLRQVRTPVTSERLQQVAEIWKQARAVNEPAPAKTVAQQIGKSHDYARHLISAARKAGYLS